MLARWQRATTSDRKAGPSAADRPHAGVAHAARSPQRRFAASTTPALVSSSLAAVLCLSALLTCVPAEARPADPADDRFVAVRLESPRTMGAERSAADDDRACALAAAEDRLRQAAALGASHVVLPELALGMEPEAVPGPSTRRLGALAEELGLWLAVSLAERPEDGQGFYVTAVLIDDSGRLRSQRRKVMPDASTPVSAVGGEPGFRRGSPRQVGHTIDDGRRKLAVLPASDLLTGVPLLALRGAEVILVPASPVAHGELRAHGRADSIGVRSDDRTALVERLAREHGVALVLASALSSPSASDPSTSDPSTSDPGTTSLAGFEASAAMVRSGHGVYAAAGRRSTPVDDRPFVLSALATRGHGWRPPTSLGLPPTPMPSVTDPRLAELGRRLFFETGLSRDGTVSCATCHDPQRAFANGESAGEGVGGRTARNVIGLLDVAHKPLLFWDGYASSLENQAKYPTSHALEMDRGYLDEVPSFLASRAEYRRAFAAVGREALTFDDVAAALSAYQRTLSSGTSAFDRFYFAEEHSALSPSARRGWELFRGKAACIDCHAVGTDHALFSDHGFHNTGIGWDAEAGEHRDLGLGWISDARKGGLFFTPSLRHVAETAPYMHDGSLATLAEVVEHYDRGGIDNPRIDPRLRPLGLSEAEKTDLVAFLESLTGDAVYDAHGRRLPGSPVPIGPEGVAGQQAAAPVSPSPAVSSAASADGLAESSILRVAALRLPTPSLLGQAETDTPADTPASTDTRADTWQRVLDARARIAAEVARSARSGARLVVLPEYSETGAPGELGLDVRGLAGLAARQWPTGVDFYSRLARRQGVHVLASLLEPPTVDSVTAAEYTDFSTLAPHHTVALFDPDGHLVTRYRKRAIVAVRGDGPGTPGREREIRAVETRIGHAETRVGVLAGDDLLDGVPRLAELGADLVLVAASWQGSDAIDWRRAVDDLPPQGLRLVIGQLDDGQSPYVRPWPTAANVTTVSVPEAVFDDLGRRVPYGQRAMVALEAPSRSAVPLGLPSLPKSYLPTTAASSTRQASQYVTASSGGASGPARGPDSIASHPSGLAMLGRALFFDPRLSESGKVSCSTCHAPDQFFADGLRFPRGVEGREGKSNTPTVINSAYRPSVFWRGDVPTLEAQVERALRGWHEMNTHPSVAVSRVALLDEYAPAFRAWLGDDFAAEDLELEHVSAALAAYERTLVAGESDFDRWYYGGDDHAFGAAQRRGFEVFVGDGRCVDCHSFGPESGLFTDQDFHNTGVGYHPRFEYLGYGGDGLETNMARSVSFRGEYLTPSLRDIERTAPYMHDGSVPDLAAVVDFYDRGGIANPRLDRRLQPLDLDARQKRDLVAFLRSLTSRDRPAAVPPMSAPVPSSVASNRAASDSAATNDSKGARDR